MYVKRGFSNCLLFVKTHYCGNKRLIVHGNVHRNIIVIKKRNLSQSVCIKDDINVDIAQKIMKYNHNMYIYIQKGIFMTYDAFIDVFVKGLDSATIVIIEFQLHSTGDMGDQLAVRLRSMRSTSDQFAIWPNRHGSLCKRVNWRGSWQSWRSVRDQSAIS